MTATNLVEREAVCGVVSIHGLFQWPADWGLALPLGCCLLGHVVGWGWAVVPWVQVGDSRHAEGRSLGLGHTVGSHSSPVVSSWVLKATETGWQPNAPGFTQ